MDDAVKQLLDYRILGIATIVMGTFIIWLLKSSAKERAENRQDRKDEHEKLIEVVEKNTDAISGFRTLLETIIKNKLV